MAVTPRPQVLDSAEFVAYEYDTDLFSTYVANPSEGGGTVVVRNYDADVLDDMHRAATRLLKPALRDYWAARGYLLLNASAGVYQRVTEEDNAEMHVGSVLVPSADDAVTAWKTVIADITADDIEEEARRA